MALPKTGPTRPGAQKPKQDHGRKLLGEAIARKIEQYQANPRKRPSESRITERPRKSLRGSGYAGTSPALGPLYPQPSHGLEAWIRRPPNRAAPTTANQTVTDPSGGRRPLRRQPPASSTALAPSTPLATTEAAPGPELSPSPATILGQPSDPPRARRPRAKESGNRTATSPRFPEPGTPSKQTVAALHRNDQRIQLANESDFRTIGGESPATCDEAIDTLGRSNNGDNFRTPPTANQSHAAAYLPATAEAFLPDEVKSPDDTFTPPAWFLAALTTIAEAPVPTPPPPKPPFRFEVSEAAVAYNGKVLAKAGFDVGRVLADHQGTTLGYGCEFRTPNQLQPLLGRHHHFRLLAELLTKGMSYHFKSRLTEAEREEELKAILARGNHKSATTEADQVSLLLAKDVTHGFSVPIPVDTIRLLMGAAVQPLGIATQTTIDEEGHPKVKFRLTQDLTYLAPRPPPIHT